MRNEATNSKSRPIKADWRALDRLKHRKRAIFSRKGLILVLAYGKSPIQTNICIENLVLFVGFSRLINRGLLRYALLALGRGLLSEPAFLHRKWLIFDDIGTRKSPIQAQVCMANLTFSGSFT